MSQESTPEALLSAVVTHYEIGQFLFQEADFLDSRRYREWLGCFAKDVRYWAPTRSNRWPREAGLEIAARDHAAIFDEDYASLEIRVRRLETERAWVEYPASRGRHFATNLKVTAHDNGDFSAKCNILVHVSRRETDEQHFFGSREDVLRRDPESPLGWAIHSRTITLDHATILADGISVFF